MPGTVAPRLILLMGVAGSGKTTLGRRLAARLSHTFIDADDFHSQEAVALMRSGAHLTDAMRDEWIERVASELLKHHHEGTSCVLAFSGLRVRHRRRLMNLGFATKAFLLTGDATLLRERITQRADHFMPPSQLTHQLDTLEAPQRDEAIECVDIGAPPEAIVDAIAAQLAS